MGPSTRPFASVLTAIVGVAVLTAFAAWSPPSFRKLVLFSLAYGLCVGGIVVWAAKEFGLKRSFAGALTVGLTTTGLGMIALRSHQLFRGEQIAAAKADPDWAMARSIINAAAAQDPQLAATLTEEHHQTVPSFTDYLAMRVTPLGEWQKPWPVVFWGAEVLFATACGVFLVARKLRSPPVDCQD